MCEWLIIAHNASRNAAISAAGSARLFHAGTTCGCFWQNGPWQEHCEHSANQRRLVSVESSGGHGSHSMVIFSESQNGHGSRRAGFSFPAMASGFSHSGRFGSAWAQSGQANIRKPAPSPHHCPCLPQSQVGRDALAAGVVSLLLIVVVFLSRPTSGRHPRQCTITERLSRGNSTNESGVETMVGENSFQLHPLSSPTRALSRFHHTGCTFHHRGQPRLAPSQAPDRTRADKDSLTSHPVAANAKLTDPAANNP